MTGLCCSCHKAPQRPTHRYCAPCHAAYVQRWRVGRPLTPEQRYKGSARSYANVYQRRGKLVPQPCEKCGSLKSEKHHHDYSKPLEVEWLCRPCHLQWHRDNRETPLVPQLPVREPVYSKSPKRAAFLKRQEKVRERALARETRAAARAVLRSSEVLS